jgi:oligo-alginate lyase
VTLPHPFRRALPTLAALTVLASSSGAQSHPTLTMTHAEAAAIRLGVALAEARSTVDSALAKPIDVPQPGEAGGYAHERHKQNYREMQAAGELYQVTGDRKYVRFVRDMLDRYAVLYPTLPAHPLAKDQAPGKLFHQSLNEANWLVGTAIAYDCVYDALTPAERARYETNVFHPMADWLSVSQAKEFDRIHNHGTWAVAAVGMIGYAMRDTSYVNRAIYGTTRDKTGGFLRQLDLLFSPDGYYMEGAYYVRYALLPFFQFAEAIERNQPSLGVYRYRDGILRKALYAAAQATYPNGVFIPVNDASRTMDITSPETVVAVDLGYARYGADPRLLGTAALQQGVTLSAGGLAVARDLAARTVPPPTRWGSVEFTDGPEGADGGLGILRSGEGPDATMLMMKYGVHGQGHGHFDKLHFTLFDGRHEVIPDYGFSRWINVEPKTGGRYLPENDSYAKQTVAHNTLVVDQQSQSNGKYPVDEAKHADRHFFSGASGPVQAMSAKADGFYDGVAMQRTMLLVRDARLPYPVVVDLYRVTSTAPHTYDLPFHYRGQEIATTAKYAAHAATQQALGTAAGYQHLWNEAEAPADTGLRLTWLTGSRYYTLTASGMAGDQAIYAQSGAGDPNFVLYHEPALILRRKGASGDQLFAAAIEPHGYFSELEERSADARGVIESVRTLGTSTEGSAVEVIGSNGLRWTVLVANGAPSATASHTLTFGGRTYTWTGNYAVQGLQAAK